MVLGRKGVSQERLKGICDYLGAPGKVQQMTFGWKIYKALGGSVHELDCVNSILLLDAVVKEYLKVLEVFLGDDPYLPLDSEPCSRGRTDKK